MMTRFQCVRPLQNALHSLMDYMRQTFLGHLSTILPLHHHITIPENTSVLPIHDWKISAALLPNFFNQHIPQP